MFLFFPVCRFTSLLLPLVFWCLVFGVCFETKVNSVGREDMTCRRTRKGMGEGRKRNSISQHQTFFNLEARAHIPEDDQRTTGESNKG